MFFGVVGVAAAISAAAASAAVSFCAACDKVEVVDAEEQEEEETKCDDETLPFTAADEEHKGAEEESAGGCALMTSPWVNPDTALIFVQLL